MTEAKHESEEQRQEEAPARELSLEELEDAAGGLVLKDNPRNQVRAPRF